MRRIILVAIGTAALAGCGSSSNSTSTTGSAPAGSNGSGSAATVISSAKNADVGTTILVDSSGRTLYLFEKDTEPDESYCNGACAKAWAPVTTSGKATAGGAVDASKLTTLKREDGMTQVVYAGHPLYTYEDDHKPGQAEGEGLKEFGAEWYAVEPSGAKAENDTGGGKS